MSESGFSFSLPAIELALPCASDKAGRFAFSAVGSAVLIVATGLGLVACGGEGGSSTMPTSVNVSGQAIKGPVSGGQVCAYTLSSPRQQIACATTDSTANYQLQLPAGTGEVLLEVTGGSYIDEATGQKVALTSPLRTLTKAGGSVENILMTPFTELAVQRATVGNPGGNLTLVSFQTQIGALETGLGITGLATGKPFGGVGANDKTHFRVLEAFSKQQATLGKSVQDTLLLLGGEIDKCGINGLGATLAIYGAVGATTTSTGGSVLSKIASTLASPSLSIIADTVQMDTMLPNPCVDGVVIDGDIQPLMVLDKQFPPTSWLNAKSVELTQCSGSLGGTLNFPSAKLVIHTQKLDFPNGLIVTSFGNYTLASGVMPIDLRQSGITVNTANGCLLPGNVTRTGGAFGGLTIVANTLSPGSGGNLGGGGSIGVGGGGAIITNGPTNGSGGGSVVVSGGGLTTIGTSSSGGGGITVSSK